MADKPWAVIMHASYEGPGLIAEVAESRGVELSFVKTYAGQVLPDWHDLGGIISMGGPMGATDEEDFPGLEAEMGLLWVAVDQGLPVLGICLGAQLLAGGLGAQVISGDRPENGCGLVTLTSQGLLDPVLGPAGETLPVLHWHSDTFTIPADGVRLASSHSFRNQAFRVGSKAYGLQFHVELNAELVEGFLPHLPHNLRIPDEEVLRISEVGRAIFERYFDVALA